MHKHSWDIWREVDICVIYLREVACNISDGVQLQHKGYCLVGYKAVWATVYQTSHSLNIGLRIHRYETLTPFEWVQDSFQ